MNKSLSVSGALCAGIFSLSLAASANAGNVDLSSWTAEGSGNWSLQPGNNAVKQLVNTSAPTVFHNNVNSQGQNLAGEITVQTTGDDDFIGFVLGYNAGDLSNASSDYLLIDWKQNNQGAFGGTALAGLSISRVTDVLPNGAGAWLHSNAHGVEELQRATTLGSTGWLDNTTYTFDLTFTSSLVEVFVNDVKELSISGSFNDGAFGFYNYSQSNVLYAGLDVSPVPEPETYAMLLAGLGLIGFVARRRKQHVAV